MRRLKEGQKSVQINVRLTEEDVGKLIDYVAEVNEQAREMGIPGTVTMNSVLRLWVTERLKLVATRGRRLSEAPHLQRASDLLRGTRKG
jgi:hypothetical protein